MPDPKIYLSGRFSTGTDLETAWLKRTGCKFRCFSYAYVHPDGIWFSEAALEALTVCEKKKVGIMMDSGAHTIHRLIAESKRRSKISDSRKKHDVEKLKDQMYETYSEYVRKNEKKWLFYVTLDYRRHQPTILAMQKRFMKDGLHPIPVYHGDDSPDWLLRYKDLGFDFICIGSIYRNYPDKIYYLDKVFNFGAKHNIKFHGLAMTSLSIITAFPWESVDSATWVRASIYGMIAIPDQRKNTTYNIHISDHHTKSNVASYNNMPRKQREMVEETIRNFGFTLKELRSGKESLDARHAYNGKVFANIFSVIDKTKVVSTEWEALV